MKVSQLTKNRKALEVTFEDAPEGESLNMVYNPSVFTPEFEDALDSEAVGGDQTKFKTRTLARMLAGGQVGEKQLSPLILEWDLQRDDDSPFPIEYSDLCTLPISVLTHLVVEIARDMRSGVSEEGKASDASSSQTGS